MKNGPAPGLTFTGIELVSRSRPRDRISRLPQFSLCACRRHYPGVARSATTSLFFEACSTFTHVTARTLAESLNDPFHRRLQTAHCLPACSDCYRLERPLPAELAPPQELCLSTADDCAPRTVPLSSDSWNLAWSFGRCCPPRRA